eukprot:1156521-Pelagomonas_calceolata.AAC.16
MHSAAQNSLGRRRSRCAHKGERKEGEVVSGCECITCLLDLSILAPERKEGEEHVMGMLNTSRWPMLEGREFSSPTQGRDGISPPPLLRQ